ncbi:hypothetical protein QBC38DRAFT_481475 [Podospora fimiseda]|uniref:Spp2/MOS2 G-patch domain-containing protein n=1 Tax=Podospora fimiseda TaxID=252190 RepID=A0AAN7H0M3_9PEZI|nr:hypothetical protein QBC38DRAFT_481475 [Podospora fimiseda]
MSDKSRVAISLGGAPQGIKQRSRPTFGKRHRAYGSEDDAPSDSENNSENEEDNDHQRSNGRVQAILTYGDDEEEEDKKQDRKRSSRHRDDKGRERDGDDRRERHRDEDRRDRHRDDEDRHHRRDRHRDHQSRSRDRSRDRHHNSHRRSASPTAEPPKKFGLTILPKSSSSKPTRTTAAAAASRSPSPPSKPNSLADQALSALLNPDSASASSTTKKRPLADDTDYNSVPIDDFGASLLKSYGWDGKLRGTIKEISRAKHGNLAGLGAKDAKGAEELDAWNQTIGNKKKDSGRPPRLEDYRREEERKKQKVEDRYGGSSYKREREREKREERESSRRER